MNWNGLLPSAATAKEISFSTIPAATLSKTWAPSNTSSRKSSGTISERAMNRVDQSVEKRGIPDRSKRLRPELSRRFQMQGAQLSLFVYSLFVNRINDSTNNE